MSNSEVKEKNMIRGISVCNPVDVEPEYFLFTIDYAIEHKMTHIQLIGPTHNYIKGNIDGMTPYRKYSQYNSTKDHEYMNMCLDVVNKGCKKAHDAGIKMYLWHHELDLPDGFSADYPEILNSDKDIEVTHPLVKDFLSNRVMDFFAAYPYMDGIILTLHETKVPLLKLKNQKLGKVERVKYITEILYDTCKSLGKELIVRPFASIEEDYEMMTKAYESISTDLLIMDKWTQFDWSLCLPHNRFFSKIKNNPIFVETDIFGEYFGKGRLPIMLKDHIKEKFAYCESFNCAGYVSRIDRAGQHPFGGPNEVNLDIMNACMLGEDIDKAIDRFFEDKYPQAPSEVRELMENTEDIQKKIFYLNTYYFTELSLFPKINHCKNHFYFEMMKENYEIVSDEWFVPTEWMRGPVENVLEEKASAVKQADETYEKLLKLKGRLKDDAYDKLWYRFANLKYVAQVWEQMTLIFLNYARYFETKAASYEEKLYKACDSIIKLNDEGKKLLGDKFYCLNGDTLVKTANLDHVQSFVKDVKDSFSIEKELTKKFESENLTDFIICAGGMEGHKIQKEVNFSDTYVENGTLYRIPGSNRGKKWSTVNTHGWFSYEIKVIPDKENKVSISLGTMGESIDIKITIDGKEHTISEKVDGLKEYEIPFIPTTDAVRIRFDRFTENTPCVYTIKVK